MTTGTVGPLHGLQLVEMAGAGSSALGRVAAAFAGMLAAQWGAQVLLSGVAPAAASLAQAPWLPDGSSALQRFLSRGKTQAMSGTAFMPGGWLITDDARVAADWPNGRCVLVEPSFDAPGRPQTELTVQAVSGLLDIVGEPGHPPLPLPGHQAAYAAGLTALLGLLAAYHSELTGSAPMPVQVSAADAATWLNWKNRLSEVSGNRQTGRDRKEEWRAVPCRDGHIAVIFRDRDVADIARLLNLPELNTPHFIHEKSRVADLDTFHALVAEALKERSKDEVLAQASALGLQFSAVLEPGEVLDDPQMIAREFFAHEEGLRMLRPPVLWGGKSDARQGARPA